MRAMTGRMFLAAPAGNHNRRVRFMRAMTRGMFLAAPTGDHEFGDHESGDHEKEIARCRP